MKSNLRLKVEIAGFGSHVPERVLTNHDLEQMVETSDEWIVQRTGVRERRLSAQVVRRKKSGFASGSIANLLLHDRSAVRDRILGVAALRERMPGLEAWVSQPAESFRGAREGSLWALLSLGIWYETITRD